MGKRLGTAKERKVLWPRGKEIATASEKRGHKNNPIWIKKYGFAGRGRKTSAGVGRNQGDRNRGVRLRGKGLERRTNETGA